MATPRLNSIWATRTCARRARQHGSLGSRFLFDYVSAEGMAVRGKYAHNRNRTCPTCMAVNNATLVHIGEVRKFGDTAPRRGELILSDLCGQFPALVEDHTYNFLHRYLLSFSVCCMLKRIRRGGNTDSTDQLSCATLCPGPRYSYGAGRRVRREQRNVKPFWWEWHSPEKGLARLLS